MALTDNVVITKLRHSCQKSLLTSDKHFRLRTIQVSYNSIVCNSVEHVEFYAWKLRFVDSIVTIWRKLLQNRIECLSKLTVSMLLVNHSALSGLKNSEVAIFDARNEERGRLPKKFRDSELQASLDEDNAQTQQQLADQLNVTREAVSIRLKAMEKIQKVGKWISHELNERQQEKARKIYLVDMSTLSYSWGKTGWFWEIKGSYAHFCREGKRIL